jgi:hypothetical protein
MLIAVVQGAAVTSTNPAGAVRGPLWGGVTESVGMAEILTGEEDNRIKEGNKTEKAKYFDVNRQHKTLVSFALLFSYRFGGKN